MAKWGKAIEEIALQRGHTIVLKIDIDNADQFTKENLAKADVAIEFTGPHSAFRECKKS
jgi:4-hydroxy-tetrahydrodipicolinate reductase